jgi:DNA-binding NarL/FixJ family response regulator
MADVSSPLYWQERLFKNNYTRAGRRMEVEGWSVKIQHQGKRHTFSILTDDKEAAAVEAKAIYETIVAEGWEAALKSDQPAPGFRKTDPRYWKEQLLERRYRFPASAEMEKSLSARIEHAGSGYYFPLFTQDFDKAAAVACKIYCTIVKQGWEAAGRQFSRELIVAFEWSANPIMWSYTTVHTLAARNAEAENAGPNATRRVLIVETDAGLRRALQWCVNRRAGCCAVPCESPEAFADAFATQKPYLVLFNRSLVERMSIELAGRFGPLRESALALAYSVSVDGDQMFVSTPGGAEGYLLKRVAPANILDPMLVNGDFPPISSEDHLAPVKLYFNGLLHLSSSKNTGALAKLTPRENEVLVLLAKGCVDKEIAEALGISAWTVHGHIKKIFERLHVRTRTEAVVRYLEK